ncbi:hypothetical protein [Cupriavidus sp. AcVe19-6a]|uniref:hypothetical protein n=1 Tax=Cupriavidus sp. AcVe19-6a TaxID=2821358 RepID=UPI001FD7669F|nr:hypothetical protein [Cupriavidus sp. AcVe19-6a]
MHEHKLRRGVFWSLSGYVGRPVQESAERAGIQLLDGEGNFQRVRVFGTPSSSRRKPHPQVPPNEPAGQLIGRSAGWCRHSRLITPL